MKYLACTDWDAIASECLASAWVDSVGFFDLTADEMRTIVAAIVGLWALAYVVKVAIRQSRYM